MTLMEAMPVKADTLEALLQKKIKANHLPNSYQKQLRDWYVPLSTELVDKIKNKSVRRPLVIGLQGAQGSGKSTLAEFIKLIIENTSDYKVGVLSLDDFYLSKSARIALARSKHALFRTRGVPGTHDIAELNRVLDAFVMRQSCLKMPRFLKYKDDLDTPILVSGDVDLVLFEGWCVGLPAQDSAKLEVPMNDVEQLDDSMGVWRNHVNQCLSNEYAALFARIDEYIFLQAPDFECVYEWRHLQEDLMLQGLHQLDETEAKQVTTMSPTELRRFMSHFERLTKHAMEVMPAIASWTIVLEALHNVIEIKKTS